MEETDNPLQKSTESLLEYFESIQIVKQTNLGNLLFQEMLSLRFSKVSRNSTMDTRC